MGRALFERSTSLFTGNWSRWSDRPYDPAVYISIVAEVVPDRRADRWDGATGVRAATAQERADYDDAAADKRAAGSLNTPVNKTLRDVLLDIEQRLRALGEISSLPGIAAANNPAKYTAALKNIAKSY